MTKGGGVMCAIGLGASSSRKVFINLIEYGVSFCILKYKSLSLYL